MLAKKFAQLALFSGLGLLAGCKRSGARLSQHKPVYEHELNEAKLFDISLPVGVTAYDMAQTDEAAEKQGVETIAFYETNFSETMLREFYQMDMERLGWKEVKTFVSIEESLLLYETPRKIAAISIRPLAVDKQGVVIFVGPRSN